MGVFKYNVLDILFVLQLVIVDVQCMYVPHKQTDRLIAEFTDKYNDI